MTASPDLSRRIAIQLAPGWTPEPGNTVTGDIVKIHRAEGDFGPYPRIVLETPAGEFVAIHAFHEVLKDQLADLHSEQKLGIGDTITVTYAGRRESRKNTGADGKPISYHQYVVWSGGPDDQPDDDPIGEDLFNN